VNDGLKSEEIEDRFYVQGRMEILNVLNDLVHRREPVTVNFSGGTDKLLTRLLEVRKKTLIFELSADLDANLGLLDAASSDFLARPDGICVQFAGGQVRRISWGGGAFSMPLPERLVRLQRQESFRILIPDALTVTLFANDDVSLGEWPLYDLSVGGLGVTVNGPSRMQLARSLVRVSLSLPGHGEIACSVTLRHATDLTKDEIDARYRIGVAFSDLSAEMGAKIQRYIIEQEYERRKLALDDAAEDHH
jgi:c-di-GMP-binding flagellar brake protein YcgR